MKKIVLLAAVIGLTAAVMIILRLDKGFCPIVIPELKRQDVRVGLSQKPFSVKEAFEFLKKRKDKDALNIFEEILKEEPDNFDALWGKAEILRRERKFEQAEALLNRVLDKNSQHSPSVISLAYIRYKDDNLDEALELTNQALALPALARENEALAYMMLGSINSRRAKKGWLFSKLKYSTQIKRHFLRARELAPEFPEVHLGLGTYYLLAPSFLGGDLNQAVKELELAVKLAPDFATANARLAQAYMRKGLKEKSRFYLEKATALDLHNEVLKEIHDK